VGSKSPKLGVTAVADVPLREVSGLAVQGNRLLAVGDHDPVVFSAELGSWPLQWHGIDLTSLGLPEGGAQFEAIESVGDHTVLVLQEQPARILHLDLARPAVIGMSELVVPEGHPLREAWLGDRSSRGESLLQRADGSLLVIKEKDPPAILEFGPIGEPSLEVVRTWWLGEDTVAALPDISDVTLGPDGRLYVLSDQGSAIGRLPAALPVGADSVDVEAVWRIAGKPAKAEGLVFLSDGTPLVALDTKAPRENLLRLEPLPLAAQSR
jgi:uncharacterized protein YjiK